MVFEIAFFSASGSGTGAGAASLAEDASSRPDSSIQAPGVHFVFGSADVDTCFWGDAICMDQDNKAEKSQQLTMMSRIYSEADRVCVWLGKSTGKTHLAFELMSKIRSWEDFKVVVEDNTECDHWVALFELLQAPWLVVAIGPSQHLFLGLGKAP